MKGLELKFLREKNNLTQEKFGNLIGKSKRTVISWEKSDKLSKGQVAQVKSALEINKSEITAPLEKQNTNEKEKKVPAYETDVTSHITTSFDDIPETPAFYVDYKPFNDCTAYVMNYGDSMFPKYKNGERLAVKQIFNLQIITWGETYLVVTNGNANDLRTVKDIHPHKEDSKIILRASNPKYAGDTVIDRQDIISMYAVKGKISQNFI